MVNRQLRAWLRSAIKLRFAKHVITHGSAKMDWSEKAMKKYLIHTVTDWLKLPNLQVLIVKSKKKRLVHSELD